jgi:hypothetical protein
LRGLSAVLSIDRLTAWRLGEARSRVILNPYARRPLATQLPFARLFADRNALRREGGLSLAEILQLPGGWP